MVTVYVVSRGKDCYAVEAVFSKKVKAEQYIEYFKGTTTYNDINEEIGEYQLDSVPEYIKEKQYSWYIQMDKNGKVIQIDKVDFRESLFNFRPTDVSDKTKGFNLTGYIHAEYTEEAIKILDEQRKWALDNNVWGNDRAFRSY